MTAKAIFSAMSKVLPEISPLVDGYKETRLCENGIIFTRRDKLGQTYIFRFDTLDDWSLSTTKGVKR